ncbi:MAG: hypothetical protein K2Q18_08385 [Bdellovibrionales bacterium]|nr:hypothetical protein [Bdellovibrionales bacterium]
MMQVFFALFFAFGFFNIAIADESKCIGNLPKGLVRCQGIIEVKNEFELKKYLADYGYVKNKYKGLVINYNLDDSKISSIVSPCEINFLKSKLNIQKKNVYS